MLKRDIFNSIALSLLFSLPVFANDLSQAVAVEDVSVDEVPVKSSLESNTVVGFFNRYWMPVSEKTAEGYYRKLIKKEGESLFLIQDFYTDNNHKQSDPVLVTNEYELKNSGFLNHVQGEYVTWYGNGQKQSSSFYKSVGVLDGMVQSWYSNGAQKSKGAYQDGKKIGVWDEWYENGQAKLQTKYADGVLDGDYARWFENSKQQAVGQYSKGLLSGFWTVWNSKGEKVSEGSYEAGKREKKWVYYTAGKKWAEGNYVDNMQDGLWHYWDAEGNKLKTIIYQKGIQVTEDNF